MTLPPPTNGPVTMFIMYGPDAKALENGLILGLCTTEPTFTIKVLGPDHEAPFLYSLHLGMLEFEFLICRGQHYTVGGKLLSVRTEADKALLPFDHFVFSYDAETRCGDITFSNVTAKVPALSI